jgi:hypothetical protein
LSSFGTNSSGFSSPSSSVALLWELPPPFVVGAEFANVPKRFENGFEEDAEFWAPNENVNGAVVVEIDTLVFVVVAVDPKEKSGVVVVEIGAFVFVVVEVDPKKSGAVMAEIGAFVLVVVEVDPIEKSGAVVAEIGAFVLVVVAVVPKEKSEAVVAGTVAVVVAAVAPKGNANGAVAVGIDVFVVLVEVAPTEKSGAVVAEIGASIVFGGVLSRLFLVVEVVSGDLFGVCKEYISSNSRTYFL